MSADSKEKSGTGSLIELVLIVATALGLALGIQAFLVKPYRIPSESMEPTITIGQRILSNRIGTRFGDPEIGDVFVFHPPRGADGEACANPNAGRGRSRACNEPGRERSDTYYIKRVVAGPGDRVSIRSGHVIRNGRRQEDGFTRPCDESAEDGCDFPVTITIPAGHWYMMGDNRGNSTDSRFWGPVPKQWFIGQAFATYWPPNRVGIF